MSNSEMALPGQLEKQFVLRFLGLGYTMILELVIMSQGHIVNISGHFALDLESNSRRVPASQGGTIMGRN